jgi:hypothetical protein
MLEAGAAGLPIVAPARGGITEFLDGCPGFAFVSDPEGQVSTVNSAAPANTTLELPRQPYALLVDSIPTFEGKAPSPSSQNCYESDFQKRLERTGNFRQITNNYKRGVPDSCSAPNHDLALSFYKVEPLPDAGCL